MDVSVKGLSKHFGSLAAVDNISFSFTKGEIHGFVGPNGAGKTTTMRIMATLDLPTAGDVEICGFSILEDPLAVRKCIGFVPDWFYGHKDMTVHEYLDLFSRMYGLKHKHRTRVLEEILDFTNLVSLKHKLVNKLSRGMQQRVCLGRALINNPEILIMDEPAANLDPRARIEFRELVVALAKRKKGILISSHILSELEEICDSLTIIDRGKILKSGCMDDYNQDLKHNSRAFLIRLVRTAAKQGKKRQVEQSQLDRARKFLLEQPGVEELEIGTDSTLKVSISGQDADVACLLKNMTASDFSIIEFRPLNNGLEHIFMKITSQGAE